MLTDAQNSFFKSSHTLISFLQGNLGKVGPLPGVQKAHQGAISHNLV